MTTVAVQPAAQPAPYSEYWAAPGVARPHQELLHRHLTERSPEELEKLRQTVRRRITEQEVTFNVLGVPEGTNRPWRLDSVPYVIDRAEWLRLSAGLRQRAELINLVVTDCYGPQRLVHEGLLPAELLFGNPEFLRSCHGWSPVGGHRLILYAADVGRDPRGEFRIYSDRTAAPTGAGYALENRLVLGRVLADLFRDYRVERIAEFFAIVRRALERLASSVRGQPRIVLLSSGSQDESSFEHAYLARYLGYELVEGRDLTVREGVVYLKTLAGLRRVDVILRRVFDSWCDPLSLREGSLQGVAGLVGAASSGRVALANPLGSSLAESPAFRSYLPRLCRFLFNQDLSLQDVDVLWCGDAKSLAMVLARFDEYTFKPAFGDRVEQPIRPAALSAAKRAEFMNKLKSRPNRYVAERWPGLSTVPVVESAGMVDASLALRVFLCRDQNEYAVMPGGLARMDDTPDGIFLAAGTSGRSKDVWICSGSSGPPPALPAMPDQRVELRRGGLDLPSRLLDDIFWLGRYVERADAMARLARAGLERVGLEASPESSKALAVIIEALRDLGAIPAILDPRVGGEGLPLKTTEALLTRAVLETDATSNLCSTLRRIHELTLRVRSRLSRDAWHVLRRMTTSIDQPPPQVDGDHVGWLIELLDELLVTIAAVSGTTLDNMVRGHAWLFLDMGRRVERGTQMVTMLRAMLPPRASRLHMEAMLEVADSLLTYRARYLSTLQAAAVVDLLLTDDTNPRSLAFQVRRIHDHLTRLPRFDEVVRSRAERRIIALESQLLTADVEQACSGDGAGLRQLLEDAGTLMWQFSDDVTQTWFSHAAPSRAMVRPLWVDEELDD